MAENNHRSASNTAPKNSRMANLHHDSGQPKRRLWLQILKWFSIGILLILVSGVGLFAYYAKDASSISQDQLQSGGSSSFYTSDGKFLLSLGSEKRTYVKNSDIPQTLKDAVVSVEDKRFYQENLG
ncbi:transglycosylase domain-containing protein, partial [Lactobacillus jensenii]